MADLHWDIAKAEELLQSLRGAEHEFTSSVLPEAKDTLTMMSESARVPERIRRDFARLQTKLADTQSSMNALRGAIEEANNIMRAAEEEVARISNMPLNDVIFPSTSISSTDDIANRASAGDLTRMSGIVLPDWLYNHFT